jgi:putative ABC transport system permease protein
MSIGRHVAQCSHQKIREFRPLKPDWKNARRQQWLTNTLRLIIPALLPFAGGCSLLHKKPPYQEPDRLVRVLKVTPPSTEEPVLGIDFLEWRTQSLALGPIAAYIIRGLPLNDGTGPERIFCGQVSADFFPLLGVPPILGRTFVPNEFPSGGAPVVILSYALWQRRFGGDPNTIGRAVALAQESYTIVGVMPDDFQLPETCDIWMPLAPDDEGLRLKDESFGLRVIGRLKPGVTIEQAQAEINTIARGTELKHPETNNGQRVRVVSLDEAKRLFPPKPQSTTIYINPRDNR